jgi:hypothetical protein
MEYHLATVHRLLERLRVVRFPRNDLDGQVRQRRVAGPAAFGAIERLYLPTGVQRGPNDVIPDQAGCAQNQNSHLTSLSDEIRARL